MSSSGIQEDIVSHSEDRSKNWANNIIEKSAGGRSKQNDEPKLNWLMIIGVFIVIVITIIYFSYNKSPDDTTKSVIDTVNNPSLMDVTIPAIDTSSITES